MVGAGLAGAVHARELAEAGHRVQVIDRRPHLAGNAHDEVDANGLRVHRYGPHLFHTRNFTDAAPLTRFTRWELLPDHLVEETGHRTVTSEEPCDYRDNHLERYYPVKTADGRFQRRYEAYRHRAGQQAPRMSFIGRCGTYQYLDMDQVINQSIRHVQAFLERGAPPR
ncbi:FAD-dependent oxidoreductase [Roseococcus sp. SYP-B2431]|uniref:FAD-dependent oxidoreductase n=1 Tax=Roseococcus sp. SYP-B2431 TaxID=2496640 RepID=UPI0019817864|nr:FAD-dependent oxidoreductase [Roseococcus sp. SYP-B2431]